MSFNVKYPSEYYKEAISSKAAISDAVKVDFTADEDTGKTPLDILAENGNIAEIKRLCANHADEVYKLLQEEDSTVMANCSTAATFKALHNCYHAMNKDYEISHFENSIGISTGAPLSYHVHRVKSDDKVDNNVKSSLTTVGLRNFITNITWTNGKTLVKNDKGAKDFTPAQETLIYLTDFVGNYYDKDDFFEIGDDGLTPLHVLVKGDNLGRFVYVIKVFELEEELDKCVDDNGNTLLNWAIQSGCKKIVEYLINGVGLSINDTPNSENCNSACSMVKNHAAFPVRAQSYVDNIDESDLDDTKFSVLNHASGVVKIDLSGMTCMSEKLMKSGTGKKGESYEAIVRANAAAVKALEEKAQAALAKAQAQAQARA